MAVQDGPGINVVAVDGRVQTERRLLDSAEAFDDRAVSTGSLQSFQFSIAGSQNFISGKSRRFLLVGAYGKQPACM
jgi:hypothetical protein